MKTGFKKLDEIVKIKQGDLVLLAGTASVGKTSFVLNVLNNIAINDKKSVLFFSLECSKESVLAKIASIAGVIEAPNILDLNDFDSLKVKKISEKIDKKSIYIDDTSGISIKEICEKSKNIKKEKDISCVIIDYLELISYGESKNLSKITETNNILSNLKNLAQELNILVLVTSYISHKKIYHKKNHVSTLEDLTSNNIDYEKYADIILLLHREECFDESTKRKNIADIIIAKKQVNISESIELKWIPKHFRFCDL